MFILFCDGGGGWLLVVWFGSPAPTWLVIVLGIVVAVTMSDDTEKIVVMGSFHYDMYVCTHDNTAE